MLQTGFSAHCQIPQMCWYEDAPVILGLKNSAVSGKVFPNLQFTNRSDHNEK